MMVVQLGEIYLVYICSVQHTIFCLSISLTFAFSLHAIPKGRSYFSSHLSPICPENNLQTNTITHCPFRSFTVLYFFPPPRCPVAIHSALQARVHAHLIPLLPPQ